jgi:hypothetical protein
MPTATKAPTAATKTTVIEVFIAIHSRSPPRPPENYDAMAWTYDAPYFVGGARNADYSHIARFPHVPAPLQATKKALTDAESKFLDVASRGHQHSLGSDVRSSLDSGSPPVLGNKVL